MFNKFESDFLAKEENVRKIRCINVVCFDDFEIEHALEEFLKEEHLKAKLGKQNKDKKMLKNLI